MKNYKLLTPGPLTTTGDRKKEMMFDHCTWDDDYKQITQKIRSGLLRLAHVSPETYTAVLMQEAGSFGVESVLTSVIGADEELLIVTNGAYGERMIEIASHAGIRHEVYMEDYNRIPDAGKVRKILADHPELTHVAMVHSETTSGILNDIEEVAKVVKTRKSHDRRRHEQLRRSGYSGGRLGNRLLISSANKCIQGVPGFSFIIARKDLLEESAGKARSLSL